MDTWRDLILAWGKHDNQTDWRLAHAQTAWSKSLGIKFKTAEKHYERNSVPSDYWSVIVARAPQAGVQGVTLEFLMSLKVGRTKMPTRFPQESRELTT
tara:strand:+ start:867 stop:1160 length:294 start_codon:yes stop_codon:yes gene_type:complete